MNRTVVEAVLEHGLSEPDKLALGFKKTSVTYSELRTMVIRCAQLLRSEYDIQYGDSVMLTALSKPEYVVILLGVQYLGATTIPIDRAAKEENIAELYQYAEPKLLITDTLISKEQIRKAAMKELYARLSDNSITDEIPYIVPDENDVAEIIFTTGTTGKPKGVMLTYGNILAITENTWHGIHMLKSDTVLIPLPLFHSISLRVLRTSLYIGASVVLQNGFTFAQDIETNINQFGCTGLVTVPASLEVVYRQMKEHFVSIMGKLRYIEVGAGSLSYDMKKKLPQILPNTNIYNTWGSSETGGAIFLDVTHTPDKLTSLGKPIYGVEIKIIDMAGQTIKADNIDTAGRMALRGAMQTIGYYHMPENTAQALVDGWLVTNDLVYTDDDGYVYMLGRADDIINIGGEKVSPIEVENIAQEYNQIRECACIGVDDPDGILGKVPILFVVPEESSFDEKALTLFLISRLDKYKIPHQYVIIDELPRNRLKKLDRKTLYSLWEQKDVLNQSNEVIRNILGRRSIREFSGEKIPIDTLKMIVRTGIYAPNGHNLQTWRFTVLQDQAKIHKLKEQMGEVSLKKGVHFYGFNSPAAVILISNDRRNADGIQDSACAAQNMMLAAHSLGIGSAWVNALMTICDEHEIRDMLREFDIPDTHIVWATLVMGYPSQGGKLPAKKQNVVRWL